MFIVSSTLVSYRVFWSRMKVLSQTILIWLSMSSSLRRSVSLMKCILFHLYTILATAAFHSSCISLC